MLEILRAKYLNTPIGHETWLLPTASLEEFQALIAAAEALECSDYIQILDIREEHQTGRRLISALRFRRLK